MTRANINYVYWAEKRDKDGWKGIKTLYYYQNGDQYPTGIRDNYKVLDFINSDHSKKAFEKWLGDNYTETKAVAYTNKTTGITLVSNYEPTKIPARAWNIKSPCIYYDTGGFITDYSYIFDNTGESLKVIAYNWEDKIFSGTAEEFTKWVKEQKN
jgi:hypothetical protein